MVKILVFLIYLYCIVAGLMALVFNYQYARDHGFLAWVFFGEIVATVKAIFWIFFIW